MCCANYHLLQDNFYISNTSNFRTALREAKTQALIGPNVIRNALHFLGGGLVLTALGTYGGLGVLETNPGIFITELARNRNFCLWGVFIRWSSDSRFLFTASRLPR